MSGRRGIPFVLSAPSGTGKTTVCKELVGRDPGIEFSVSHTTRPRRKGEVDGRDYHFVDREGFEARVREGAFVEWAEFGGNLYGTSFDSLDRPLASGRDLLLEIEVQGAAQLRERRRDARFLFLLPPSMEELERRLRGRGTDDDSGVVRRLALARRELRAVHHFDYVVLNDALEATVEALQAIVAAERRGATEAVRARFGREATLRRVGERFELDPA